MAEVKWIHLNVDMFDNRKIRYLRKLPAGNDIILIWVMLLTLAGKCNAGGMIMLTQNVPYTVKMLADEFEFDENTVRLALEAFENLGMVSNDGFIMISGWEEHQNTEGLDKIREYNRIAKQKSRERQKQKQFMLATGVNDMSMTSDGQNIDPSISISNSISLSDNNKESNGGVGEERENGKKDNKPKERKKRTQKEFVPPTLEEVEAYASEKGYDIDCKYFWEYYSEGNWIDGKGDPVKNWKQKLITWAKNVRGDKSGTGSNKQGRYGKVGGANKGIREKDPDLVYFDANDESTWYLFDG